MTNEDLKRFYETNNKENKDLGFVRYDENGEIPGGGGSSTVSVEVGTTTTSSAGKVLVSTNTAGTMAWSTNIFSDISTIRYFGNFNYT